MKNLIFVFIALIISMSAQAQVENIITCQQEDQSGAWLEINIILNGSKGFRAIVLEHNNNRAQPKTLANTQISTTVEIGTTIFRNELKTLDLRVAKVKSQLRGNFVLLQDGPNSINALNLLCTK